MNQIAKTFLEGESPTLNHIIHMEERIIDFLKSLKNQNEILGSIMITYIHQV